MAVKSYYYLYHHCHQKQCSKKGQQQGKWRNLRMLISWGEEARVPEVRVTSLSSS